MVSCSPLSDPKLRQNSLHNGRSTIVVFPYTTDEPRTRTPLLSFLRPDRPRRGPQRGGKRASLPLLNCLPSLLIFYLLFFPSQCLAHSQRDSTIYTGKSVNAYPLQRGSLLAGQRICVDWKICTTTLTKTSTIGTVHLHVK